MQIGQNGAAWTYVCGASEMGRAVTTSASKEKETRMLTVIVSNAAESDLPNTIERV